MEVEDCEDDCEGVVRGVVGPAKLRESVVVGLDGPSLKDAYEDEDEGPCESGW